MNVNLIAAVGKHGQLGLNGRLPWRDPSDMAWFLHMTRTGLVVLGPKTAVQMPGSFFKDRSYLVHSFIDERCEPILEHALKAGVEDVWIAGGAGLYRAWIASGLITRAYVGLIDYDGPADVYLPPIWQPK